MSDPAQAQERVQEQQKTTEIHSFLDVIRSLLGRVVTVANPESLEDAPMGFQLNTGFYRAKILAVQGDFITVATELVHRGKEASKEPVKQFIPLARIKRVTVAKAEVYVHI